MPLRVPLGGESGRTERRLVFNIGTSRHKQEALGYAAAGAGGQAPTLFEMQTGMVDRGASMACLSQSMVKVAVLAGHIGPPRARQAASEGSRLLLALVR